MPKIVSRSELSSRTGAREGSEQRAAVKPTCRFFFTAGVICFSTTGARWAHAPHSAAAGDQHDDGLGTGLAQQSSARPSGGTGRKHIIHQDNGAAADLLRVPKDERPSDVLDPGEHPHIALRPSRATAHKNAVADPQPKPCRDSASEPMCLVETPAPPSLSVQGHGHDHRAAKPPLLAEADRHRPGQVAASGGVAIELEATHEAAAAADESEWSHQPADVPQSVVARGAATIWGQQLTTAWAASRAMDEVAVARPAEAADQFLRSLNRARGTRRRHDDVERRSHELAPEAAHM